MTQYSKPALSISRQIQLLQNRGMTIRNKQKASAFLTTCNFYRFAGFARFFLINSQARPQQYKNGTRFEDVVNLIDFDRALRLLVLDSIERLEIAIRSTITSKGAVFYRSSHWYLDPYKFKSFSAHSSFVANQAKDFERSKETFAIHYKQTYSDPDIPPVWVIAEITSLGKWSHLYKNLKSRKLRNQVAKVFASDHIRLEKNLHVLSYLRNLAAHHSRIWNRVFTIKPTLTQYGTTIPAAGDSRIAAQMGMVWIMLQAIEPKSLFIKDMRDLLLQHGISANDMGFQANWEANPFWGL
jgi:abortive infection bacteriophage resistance protein